MYQYSVYGISLNGAIQRKKIMNDGIFVIKVVNALLACQLQIEESTTL